MPTSISTKMELDQVVVEDAETLFLSGNFRESLFLCNKLLTRKPATTCYPHETRSLVELSTPLYLSIDAATKKRRLCIQMDINSEKTCKESDRAAILALQSWYEIARSLLENERSQDHQNHSGHSDDDLRRTETSKVAQGYALLQPFLSAYTYSSLTSEKRVINTGKLGTHNRLRWSSARPMPLEMAIIFIRFLPTDVAGHIHESVELCCEILHKILKNSLNDDCADTTTAIPAHLLIPLEELFEMVFVEFLPYCKPQKAVAKILKRFLQPNNQAWVPAATPLVASRTLKSDSIVTIISFLRSLPASSPYNGFPSKYLIQRCSDALCQLLKVHDLGNKQRSVSPFSQRQKAKHEESVSRDSRRLLDVGSILVQRALGNKGNPGVFTPPHSRRGGNIFMKVTAYASQNAQKLAQKMKERKGNVAFFIFIFLFIFKKRHRVRALSSSVFRLFLAPIQEVVDATLKPR